MESNARVAHIFAALMQGQTIPRFKIEVQHLIKQTNLHKKAMKTYSC